MQKSALIILLAGIVATYGSSASAQNADAKRCPHDRAQLLALDERQFDQDLAGGWRQLSNMSGCTLVAADLLRDYQQTHNTNSGLMSWHEAQLRANAGQYPEAIALMKRSYKPAHDDQAGWNAYVDATIAFLRRDKPALQRARQALSAVQAPVRADVPPVVDGYMEVDFADGSKRKIRWPPNIDVVEGLEACFDKPYAEAYGNACRPGNH